MRPGSGDGKNDNDQDHRYEPADEHEEDDLFGEPALAGGRTRGGRGRARRFGRCFALLVGVTLGAHHSILACAGTVSPA